MPARKTNSFTKEEKQVALIGRALSHPARVRIINVLINLHSTRNIELIKELNLCKSSVSNHVKKLEEASLINLLFLPNQNFLITLDPEAERKINDMIGDMFCSKFNKV